MKATVSRIDFKRSVKNSARVLRLNPNRCSTPKVAT